MRPLAARALALALLTLVIVSVGRAGAANSSGRLWSSVTVGAAGTANAAIPDVGAYPGDLTLEASLSGSSGTAMTCYVEVTRVSAGGAFSAAQLTPARSTATTTTWAGQWDLQGVAGAVQVSCFNPSGASRTLDGSYYLQDRAGEYNGPTATDFDAQQATIQARQYAAANNSHDDTWVLVGAIVGAALTESAIGLYVWTRR